MWATPMIAGDICGTRASAVRMEAGEMHKPRVYRVNGNNGGKKKIRSEITDSGGSERMKETAS